jgi:TRAP-type C4-dicarboxylate transport system permease small subunit
MKQFTKNKLERYKQSALDLIMVALCFYALGWLIIYGVNWFNNMVNWLFYGV